MTSMQEASADSLHAVAGVLLGLSVITIALRFFARHRQRAPLLVDDWLLLPALITFAGTCACLFFGEEIEVFGYSSHDSTPEKGKATRKSSAKTQLALNLLSIASLGFVKLSALFFYKRIFCVAGRKATFNIIVLASIVTVICWMVTYEFLIGFQCGTHIEALWNGTGPKYCTSQWPGILSQAISDFLLDFWVLLLPIYPIVRLQTTRARKFAIIGVFLLASIGIGSSIARLVLFVEVNNGGRNAYLNIDLGRSLSRLLFYMILEIGVGLIAICLPSIWMVFASIVPEVFLRSVHSVLSLVTLASRRSKDSQERSRTTAVKPGTPNSSIAPIAGKSARYHEPKSAPKPYPGDVSSDNAKGHEGA
ncbi:hypothetical protein NOR_03863 [Metarhizium rileyi]|uniref:Rhodopsin domain-containing protein n=1 Tax=Metarhizium rileyi (strain RCEF 4871) TaxID=1649241 RepID=A0A162HVX0_METRR|nr:hypothetical protein NOR_03863 [Metarhizium rileyi RCEF 4871]